MEFLIRVLHVWIAFVTFYTGLKVIIKLLYTKEIWDYELILLATSATFYLFK